MSEKSERILDEAQLLVQQRGFNAFSFRDLTQTLGMTNAGIHYHFPTKVDLGRAMVARYRRHFMDSLTQLDQTGAHAFDRLYGFISIYANVLRSRKFCLCGMMAADALTLPEDIHGEILAFFSATEEWLAGVLASGKEHGKLHYEGPTRVEAQTFFSVVQGAMLVCWPMTSKDPANAATKFEAITKHYVAQLISQ